MARLEQLRPQLKKGTWEVTPLSIIFKAEGELLKAELPHEAKPIVKLLNGSYSLSELVGQLFHKNIPLRFQLILEVVSILGRKNLFVNSAMVNERLEEFYSNQYGGQNKSMEINSADYFSKKMLQALIQKTPLAPNNLTQDLDAIINHSNVLLVKENDMLIKNGTVGDKVYLLLNGSMGVYAVDKEGYTDCVGIMGDLSLFGESSAILGKKRLANVVAHKDSWVLEVNIHEIINIQDNEDYTSFKSLKTRLLINQILITAPIFQSLPHDVMQLFTSKCDLVTVDEGEVIIFQNDHLSDSSVFLRPNLDDHSFYFLIKGSVEVLKNGKHICDLEKGSYFGEVGALNEVTRTASVRTKTPCHVLKLSSEALNDVLAAQFKLALKMEEVADQRTKESLETLEEIEMDEKTQEILIDEISLSSTHFDLDDSLVEIDSIEAVDFKLE
ncbi:MAG: cyclic nucleotide-binding domain-containing protein [Bdellovibrionaceae bacterium]|jgi:CRP-like cAMP-binding protein|nr:cyclic nucleotide-binding domain-containing protein [Pseudobdellovibrionaceae bacterium]